MKNKVLTTIFILLLLISISKSTFAINDILDSNFDTLNGISFVKTYSSYSGKIDDQKGILCIHDSSFEHGSYNLQYGLDMGSGYAYYYYDKIVINGDGKNPRKIEYSNVKGTTYATESYKGTAAYMARLFYGRNEVSDNWVLLQQYRFFCVDYMARGFKNWCAGKGSFNYFVHEKDFSAYATDSEYDSRYYNPTTSSKAQEAKELNRSCLEYSNFVSSLNGKYTIENKKNYTVSDAINDKESAEVDTTANWSLEVSTPYYKPYVLSGYYDNVVYEYAFIDSSNYNASSITWNTATVSNTPDESGYENITLKGSANTNENANTLILKCSYKTYSGIALGFATWNGQERFLVNGKENNLISYVAYDIVSEPNITISKKIVKINDTTKNVKSADVEIGDTVIFKVTVKNKGTATRTVTLKDDLATSKTSGLILKQVGVPNTKDSSKTDWGDRATWNGKTETINPGDTFVRYFKFEVSESASGTIENIATITCDEELDSNGRKSKSSKASVSILEYNYKISKKVVSITNARNEVRTRINNDGETVNETSKVEPGDIVKFKITLRNYNKAKLKYVIIQDVLQEGLTLVDCYEASTNGAWEITEDYTSNQATMKMTDGGSRGLGTKTFYIEARVDTAPVFDPNKNINEIKLTNTVTITQVKNKHKINIIKKVDSEDLSDTATVKVLDYSYRVVKQVASITSGGVERTNNLDTVEKGDIIKYSIDLENLNEDCCLYEVHMKDILSDGLKYLDYDEPQNKGLYWEVTETSTNVVEIKMIGDTVRRNHGVKRFYIIAEVVKDINDSNKIIGNSVQTLKIKNVNGKELENVSDEVSVTMLSYDASLNKYITKYNETNITDRVGVSNAIKFDNPVIVKQGDKITYTIEIENKGTEGTVIYNPQIEDILEPGLEYESHSSGWTRDASTNTYTYNDKVGAKDGENIITLNITAKVTMSNIYLYNLKNEAKYGIVKNVNGVDISSSLTLENNEDFVRLDELDIAGTVWEDLNKDGIMDSDEPRLEGITVILHNKTDGSTITKTTDESGNYKFDKDTEVLKGTQRLENGNYQNGLSEHKEYYVEFVYDGVTYKNTKYSGKDNLEQDDLALKEEPEDYYKYKFDSNALEDTKEREEFNEKLAIISYNKAHNSAGEDTIDLKYERVDYYGESEEEEEEDNISIEESDYEIPLVSGKALSESFLKKDDEELKISSYSFGKTEMLWLKGEASEVSNPDTEYLEYINLGLINKDADLEVKNKLEAIITTINGQRVEYIRPESYETKYNGGFYTADYEYKYNQRYSGNAEIMALKGEESELNCELRFKTRISNNGKVYAKVEELFQGYDSKFIPVFNNDGSLYTQKMRIDTNDDGEFESEDFEYKFEVTYEHLAADGTIKKEGTAIATLTKKYTGYTYNSINEHIIYISIPDEENVVLGPGDYLDIYTTYIMSKDGSRNIKLGNYSVVSEINAYSTYEDVNGQIPAGSVDIDSNPGNIRMKKVGHTTVLDSHYYEDDTDKIVYGASVNKGSTRKAQGTVWEDENEDGKLGSEPKVDNVKVKLIEVIKNGSKYEEYAIDVNPIYDGDGNQTNDGDESETYVITNRNGNYVLKNFIPGLYIVRFIYGDVVEDLEYNGQDYKSTKYIHEDVENFEPEKDNTIEIAPSYAQRVEVSRNNSYPLELRYLMDEALSKEVRCSDARDDEKRRLETINYSLEMYNEKAEILKYEGELDKEKDKLAELYMYADTATFLVKTENIPPKSTDASADYLIHIGDLPTGVLNENGQMKYGNSMWFISNETNWKQDERDIIAEGGNKGNNVSHKWADWREAGKLYRRNYVLEYIDFGVQKRPENKLKK